MIFFPLFFLRETPEGMGKRRNIRRDSGQDVRNSGNAPGAGMPGVGRAIPQEIQAHSGVIKPFVAVAAERKSLCPFSGVGSS